jgi:predicted dehydrogenase
MTHPDRRTFLQTAAAGTAALALQPELAAAPRLVPGQAPLRIAVVGAGRQGRAVLAELQKLETAQVVAVCDSVASRLRAGVRRVSGAKGYDSHEQLFADGGTFDAVVVATSTHAHKEVALAALAAQKHVYCEAPLAHSLEDSKAIARAAKAGKAVFAAGLLARSNPIYKLALSFHRAGVLDKLLTLRAQDHQRTSWRFPGEDPASEQAFNWRLDPARAAGLPGELGTHQFDVLHWYASEYPVLVRGRGAVRAWADGRTVADTVQCSLDFPSGLQLQWSATLGGGYEGRYEILAGSLGAMRLAWAAGWLFKESEAPTQGWEVYANRESFHTDTGITLIADATKLAKQGKLKEGVGLPNPPLYYGLADFVASCTTQAPVACTAEEGHRATAVGLKAQEAVLTGVDLAIDPKDLQVD